MYLNESCFSKQTPNQQTKSQPLPTIQRGYRKYWRNVIMKKDGMCRIQKNKINSKETPEGGAQILSWGFILCCNKWFQRCLFFLWGCFVGCCSSLGTGVSCCGWFVCFFPSPRCNFVSEWYTRVKREREMYFFLVYISKQSNHNPNII